MAARPLLSVRAEPAAPDERAAEERFAVASQLQLTWWRFRRHRLAVVSGVVVMLFYLVVVFADFLATRTRTTPNRGAATSRRRPSTCSTTARFVPLVYGLKRHARPAHLQASVYAPDAERKVLPDAVRAQAIRTSLLGPASRPTAICSA